MFASVYTRRSLERVLTGLRSHASRETMIPGQGALWKRLCTLHRKCRLPVGLCSASVAVNPNSPGGRVAQPARLSAWLEIRLSSMDCLTCMMAISSWCSIPRLRVTAGPGQRAGEPAPRVRPSQAFWMKEDLTVYGVLNAGLEGVLGLVI